MISYKDVCKQMSISKERVAELALEAYVADVTESNPRYKINDLTYVVVKDLQGTFVRLAALIEKEIKNNQEPFGFKVSNLTQIRDYDGNHYLIPHNLVERFMKDLNEAMDTYELSVTREQFKREYSAYKRG